MVRRLLDRVLVDRLNGPPRLAAISQLAPADAGMSSGAEPVTDPVAHPLTPSCDELVSPSDEGVAAVDLEDDARGQFAAEKEAIRLGDVSGFRDSPGWEPCSHLHPHLV